MQPTDSQPTVSTAGVKSPSAGMQPTVKLTPEQIAFYHREGYLVLDAISTPAEIEWMKEIYDRLFQQRAGREKGDQFDLGGTDEEGKQAVLPQILGPSRYAPELIDALYRVNAASIARQLLGPEVVGSGDHAIFKPARIGAETPWHQDEAYWSSNIDYNKFSLWMPLQPARVDNGCMEFVPRSHKGPVVPHRSIGNDPRVHGLEMDQPPRADQTVCCPIPAGGCTIHHNRTWHHAGPNRRDISRRAYIMVFGLPVEPKGQRQEFSWNAKKQTARDERAKAAAVTEKQPGV